MRMNKVVLGVQLILSGAWCTVVGGLHCANEYDPVVGKVDRLWRALGMSSTVVIYPIVLCSACMCADTV